jgi:Mg2+ and Co2+ transporter CorA
LYQILLDLRFSLAANMTTKHYYQAYQQLEQLLQQFQAALGQAETPTAELRTTVLDMQHRFQSQILPLAATLESTEDRTEDRNRIDALQLEINKQLRLLETDTLFLQAARQPETAQQRKQQMQSRLEMLLRYCDGILALVTGVENGPG